MLGAMSLYVNINGNHALNYFLVILLFDKKFSRLMLISTLTKSSVNSPELLMQFLDGN